jgi:hypothetical protein
VVVCDNGTGVRRWSRAAPTVPTAAGLRSTVPRPIAQLVKCGFAGDNFPRSVFPCMVGRPVMRFEDHLSDVKPMKVGSAVPRQPAALGPRCLCCCCAPWARSLAPSRYACWAQLPAQPRQPACSQAARQRHQAPDATHVAPAAAGRVCGRRVQRAPRPPGAQLPDEERHRAELGRHAPCLGPRILRAAQGGAACSSGGGAWGPARPWPPAATGTARRSCRSAAAAGATAALRATCCPCPAPPAAPPHLPATAPPRARPAPAPAALAPRGARPGAPPPPTHTHTKHTPAACARWTPATARCS